MNSIDSAAEELMPKQDDEVAPSDNRQSQIEQMEVGDSVSIARRISLDYGLPAGKISEHGRSLRGSLDKQADRARRKSKSKKYTVEHGSFLSRDGAIILVAVASRTE